MASRGSSISLRELRIAKLGKRTRTTLCAMETEAYLTALAAVGGDSDQVSSAIGLALSNCMKASVSYKKYYLERKNSINDYLFLLQAVKVRPASVQFHLQKFVKRK